MEKILSSSPSNEHGRLESWLQSDRTTVIEGSMPFVKIYTLPGYEVKMGMVKPVRGSIIVIHVKLAGLAADLKLPTY